MRSRGGVRSSTTRKRVGATVPKPQMRWSLRSQSRRAVASIGRAGLREVSVTVGRPVSSRAEAGSKRTSRVGVPASSGDTWGRTPCHGGVAPDDPIAGKGGVRPELDHGPVEAVTPGDRNRAQGGTGGSRRRIAGHHILTPRERQQDLPAGNPHQLRVGEETHPRRRIGRRVPRAGFSFRARAQEENDSAATSVGVRAPRWGVEPGIECSSVVTGCRRSSCARLERERLERESNHLGMDA